MTTLYVVLGIIVVIALLVVSMYNGLIRLKNRVDEAWSDIDVQLKRRYDLIPNLIETVKGYAAHEQATFEKVVTARNLAMSAQQSGDAEAQAQAENTLSGTLKSIFALAENYPDLKANQNFLELQSQLEGTENRINVARDRFNSTVEPYNLHIKKFPNSILAGIFNFDELAYYKADAGSENAPDVNFEFN